MKVKELIELLQKLEPERIVVMSKDAEGNGFSPLADYSDQYHYSPDSTWSGELRGGGNREPFDDEEPYEPKPGDEPCVVLWPVN